ncbi:hypothetical protein DMJ13_12735 [halophilic archaeon]|nr:hypothetical protein DMJ13_12735 [halophilic archaeon]
MSDQERPGSSPADTSTTEAHRLRSRERAMRRAYKIIADSDRSFSQQIEELLQVVREAIGTDYATVSRVHQDADQYIFETVDVPDDVDLQSGFTVPLAELPNCAHVVETEQTLVLEDVEAEAPELADPTWGISCYLGAPVTVDGDIYGTFCFYGMEPRSEEFSDWDVTFVELLSNWVSSELDRQRQNDRLESFASLLAHELRNPLTIGQMYCNELPAETAPDAVDYITESFDRIEELIDILLVIARRTDVNIDREAVELADAATEAWDTVVTDEADLVVETDRVIEADPVHVQHFLDNLFSNAVEHGSSDVTIHVGDLPTGFYVADDGSGISEEKRGQVFQAGYTTEANGTGLGLTFVAELANTYEWDWRLVESDDGGARFEFEGVQCVSEA